MKNIEEENKKLQGELEVDSRDFKRLLRSQVKLEECKGKMLIEKEKLKISTFEGNTKNKQINKLTESVRDLERQK